MEQITELLNRCFAGAKSHSKDPSRDLIAICKRSENAWATKIRKLAINHPDCKMHLSEMPHEFLMDGVDAPRSDLMWVDFEIYILKLAYGKAGKKYGASNPNHVAVLIQRKPSAVLEKLRELSKERRPAFFGPDYSKRTVGNHSEVFNFEDCNKPFCSLVRYIHSILREQVKAAYAKGKR